MGLADFLFTLKVVVVLLVVCGLDLGLVAILLFTRNVTISPRHKILLIVLLSVINLLLVTVGYLAFFGHF